MSLETMELSAAEKRFLIAAINIVEMHKGNILSREDVAHNLVKRFDELGIAEIRASKGSENNG